MLETGRSSAASLLHLLTHPGNLRRLIMYESEMMTNGTSLWGLVKEFVEDSKFLVKEEVQLAKTEVSEKVAMLAKNTVPIAIGGCVGYAGFIVLLIGLGLLGAYGLEQAGLPPILAGGIAVAVVGLLVA